MKKILKTWFNDYEYSRFLMILLLLFFFASCEQQNNVEKYEMIEPDYENFNGVVIDSSVAVQEFHPGDEFDLVLSIVNYFSYPVDVKLNILPSPYFDVNSELPKIVSLKALSELYPKGYETKVKIPIKIKETISAEKNFMIAVHYCYCVNITYTVPVCVDFVKSGLTSIVGCSFNSPHLPPKGSPIYISKIDESIKKQSDGVYSVTFRLNINNLNKTFFMGSCGNAIRYNLLEFKVGFENQQESKQLFLFSNSDDLIFNFKTNKQHNYVTNLQINYSYCIDDAVSVDNLYIIP